jgi:hypothetical protein
MSGQPEVADVETEQTINTIDKLNKENDAALAEVARLKRKYEPDDGIIIDKLLKLTDDHACRYMRVLVRTGEYLLLELVPDVRNNGNVPNWEFRPPVDGKHGHMQDFGSYGVYEVYIGGGAFGHTCLVNFDKPGVSITAIHEPMVQGDAPLSIEEVTQAPTVTLAAGKRARTDQ